MALLRRGSSHISEDNHNARLVRDEAKSGSLSASLAWNDPSDLDIHCHVKLKDGRGEHIYFRHKEAAGGKLDVDHHARDVGLVDEPVENIFWEKPPPGDYWIEVDCFKKRGFAPRVPFRCQLKREGEETLSVEGGFTAAKQKMRCFNFKIDDDGKTKMLKKAATATFVPERAAGKAKAKAKAREGPGAKAKAKGKAKGKAEAKAKGKAKGKAEAKAKGKAKGKAEAKAKPKAKVVKVMKAILKYTKAPKLKPKTKTAKKMAVQKVKAAVFAGTVKKTKGGLTKDMLEKNKFGRVVIKKASARGKSNKWAIAISRARTEMGFSGFRPLKKDSEFYIKTKAIYSTL